MSNAIFEVNYAVFSVFAALLITEVMGALALLIAWDEAREKVLSYVIPIWEVTGTFGAFWVVTGDFAYPRLLVPVAEIFSPLLVVFLILFVARNSAISFAEFVVKRKWLDEAKLYRCYAWATVLLGLTVMVLLAALVGGEGVNLSEGTFSIVSWATPASLAFVVGALLLMLGLAPVVFDLADFRKYVLPLVGGGVVVSVASYWLMVPGVVSWWVCLPVALTVLGGALYLLPRTSRIATNKLAFVSLLSLAIFSLQPLVYPAALGNALLIDQFTTSGVMADAFLSVTVAGGALLAVMLGLYVRVAGRGPSGSTTPSAIAGTQ